MTPIIQKTIAQQEAKIVASLGYRTSVTLHIISPSF